MKRLAVFFLLLLASPCPADPPKLDLPAEVKGDPEAWLVVSPATTAKAVTYIGLDKLTAFPSAEQKDPKKLIVYPAKAGRYRFVAVGTLNDEQAVRAFVVVVGDAPPDPGPGPDPSPGPTPAASPFKVDGLHVLILEESKDRTKLGAGHRGIMFGQDFRTWLDSVTPLDPDGKTHAWRIYDKDVAVTGETPAWAEVMKRQAPAQLPWLTAHNGKAGYDGPLPDSAEKAKEIIRKLAGK
jgi:hypothetical protein